MRQPQFNDEKTVAIVFVTPQLGAAGRGDRQASSPGCASDIVPAATRGGPAVAYVSGQTAAFKDIADQIIEQDADLPALHHRRDVPRS